MTLLTFQKKYVAKVTLATYFSREISKSCDIPLPVKSANLRIFNCSIFLPKNVNFQGSGSAIFSAVWQITISGKFSSIFIPEIAKTDFERFEKPLTAANFLALSRRNY